MKKIIILFIFSLFIFSISIQAQWRQIGSDLDGLSLREHAGNSTSISSDGSKVAVGVWDFNGHVRVYQNISNTWEMIGGASIIGETNNDLFGVSVSLSSDGSTIAIGSPMNDGDGYHYDCGNVRVYQFISGTWTQIGQDIDGENGSDESGWAVSLNADGSIVAIGSPRNDGNGNDSGQVRVYQNISGTWTQIGQDLDGEAAGDSSGTAVSLNADGTVVAIGASNNSGNGAYSGHVRVYQYNHGSWLQIGQDIDGEAAYNYSGTSVSLNADGSIVAIGAPLEMIGNNTDPGYVRVFQNISGTWTQIGQDIVGESRGDKSGYSVSLNADGSIVAIGAPKNDGNGNYSGQVRVYQNISGTWTQLGQDIDGENVDDWSGSSVSLNADGSIVAIGSPYHDGNYDYSGQVRVYKITITEQPVSQNNICPGSNISFNIAGMYLTSYQWQVDEGNGFVNISNGGVYSGATTGTLNITGVNLDMNNYQYRCIVTNIHGSETSDIVTLTTDNEAPIPDNTTLSDITATCEVTTLTPPTATDNCSGTMTGTPDVTLPVTTQGTTVVTWTFDDGNGNTSTQTQNIIIDDHEAPIADNTTLPDVTAACEVTTLTPPTATDNCAGTVTGTPDVTLPAQATTVVTWTFDDGNGNTSTQTQNIIINDVTPPTITCPNNQTIDLNQGETFYTVSGTEFDPLATGDNCQVASAINNYNNANSLDGAQIPIGTTTIEWTVTDNAGNQNTCSFDVAVNDYVGISELQKAGISIYPNPSTGIFNLKNADNYDISITDITGKIVYHTIATANEKIRLHQRGVYIINFRSAAKNFSYKILVK